MPNAAVQQQAGFAVANDGRESLRLLLDSGIHQAKKEHASALKVGETG